MSVLVSQPPATNGLAAGNEDIDMSAAAPAAAASTRFASGMILPPPEIKGALARCSCTIQTQSE